MTNIPKRKRHTCAWEPGELIAFQTNRGDYVILRILSLRIDKGGTYPNFEMLDWRGDQLPTGGLPETTPVRQLVLYGPGTRCCLLPIGERTMHYIASADQNGFFWWEEASGATCEPDEIVNKLSKPCRT